MARMRSLKPEFWHDQEITRLPRDARLLYMAMWNLADEHARLQGDPRYLKGQAFPYDDDLTSAAIDALIDRLVELGKVQRLFGKRHDTRRNPLRRRGCSL